MLKNALIYTLVEPITINKDDLEDRLRQQESTDIRKDQGRALGWTPPAGRSSDVLVHELEGQRLIAVMHQTRVLPKDVVNEEVEERAQAMAERQGTPITKKEKAALKEEITLEKLKVSHVRKKMTRVWWDTRRGRIIVEATSDKQGEAIMDLLRESLGSLKVVPMATKTLPVKGMTEWLNDPAARPGWLGIGEEAELKDSEDGSSYAAKKADLETEEATSLLSAGRKVTRLGIKSEGYLKGTLTDKWVLKGIKYDDAVLEQADQDADPDNHVARLESDFIILCNALATVISDLVDALGGIAESKTADEKIAEAENSAA